ncbi:hypothetical protein ASPZODRAFT_67506 [Penicilliopsis zonata CBS 506.65]|uniref:C3H1-type domain-containing protein n=1 Tax=Penicilliopsis zonata CBS 506.65 TaxID=1073090 RepID=A0A1L9SFR8_9EURO|nr:hypothetical protein ASPZODRAFT_67506 [Penicilliopsis zonata CBS 506.65]OJJ46125.1 hypothetical protein ASPZODRAFT_67506 [Penicilliopsis zonata CBS 506.65]
MTEDQDLLAKISQLAGQINRHKNQSSQAPAESNQYVSRHASRQHNPGWAPYRGRANARRPVAPHRHRTLILNNSTASASAPSSTSSAGPASDNDTETRPAASQGWVAKRDRHMQLINTAIYDQETQARTKAIEESRRLKTQKRAQLEEAKVLRYAQGAAGGRQFPVSVTSQPSTVATQTGGGHQIFVNDIPFKIARGGSKLLRVSSGDTLFALFRNRCKSSLTSFIDDPNTANNTPKKVVVAGVTFVRSKNGNLHRLGLVKSKRKTAAVKRHNELCKRFSTTGTLLFPPSPLNKPTRTALDGKTVFLVQILIQPFLRFPGTCYKGPMCPFIHDPNKVTICKEFLQTGKCNAGSSCDLSHEPSPHRSPACVHFLRGRCSNPECRYAHVRVTPGAPVCRDFATLGYCEKGAECDQRHVHECPDYANTGSCNKKRCPLPHVDRAGQIRKMAAANKADSPDNDEDEDDLSSEEEYDEIDSDDVDSDELDDEPEELIAGADSGEISQQRDFVRF